MVLTFVQQHWFRIVISPQRYGTGTQRRRQVATAGGHKWRDREGGTWRAGEHETIMDQVWGLTLLRLMYNDFTIFVVVTGYVNVNDNGESMVCAPESDSCHIVQAEFVGTETGWLLSRSVESVIDSWVLIGSIIKISDVHAEVRTWEVL